MKTQGYSANRFISTPYAGVTRDQYEKEKRRLQIEMLKIQTKNVEIGGRICILFDGRDASGKGSTIHRFYERMMPQKVRIVNLGIPTKKESKYWFNRYKKHLPKPGEIVLFDRSWYNRALIEPTMGYCTKEQYKYFIKHVLDWELELIENGLKLIKFYLSVDIQTQLIRFQHRLSDPLTYWKYSPNDIKAQNRWETFTRYKEQMFKRTSHPKSPWVVISSKRKMDARLTAMLHFVRSFGDDHFKPLTEELVKKDYKIEINGIPFLNLTIPQFETLKSLVDRASLHHNIDIKYD